MIADKRIFSKSIRGLNRSALCQVGARCTNRRIALEHSVTIPVGRTVTQDLVVRADHAVVVIVVDIVTGAEKAFLSHRPLVGHRRVSTGIDHLLADPRGLVRRIKCECFDPWEPLHQRIVDLVKGNAVMNIAGSDANTQCAVVLLACHMDGVGKYRLVITFLEQTAVWVSCRSGYRNLFGFRFGFERLFAVLLCALDQSLHATVRRRSWQSSQRVPSCTSFGLRRPSHVWSR